MQVPLIERPSYCSDTQALSWVRQEPLKPLEHAMHPCNFLEASQVPVLPEWGPELWKMMSDIRERRRWRTWESSWHR